MAETPPPSRRLLSLDALRGIAVFLMIEQHLGVWLWRGLQPGEHVVTNGNFQLDSAVQILATGGMMTLPGNQLATAHQHPGGSEEMHEDYVRERTKSRMTREEPSTDVHTGRRSNRHGADDHGDSSSSVRRRRPGMYGDSTRTIRSFPTTP